MQNESLYRCLIAEQTDETAFVQTFWARAPHLGHAIEKMVATAREIGLVNPQPGRADPFELANLAGEIYPDSSAEVFYATTRFSFPPEPSFEIPDGVIPSFSEGERDPDDIRAGYCRTRDEEGLIEIEVNAPTLLPSYEDLLALYPSYRTFWYLIHDHWDDSSEEFYVNSALNSPGAIGDHLRANLDDSIRNGFVTLTAFLDEGATNLSLTEHKQIVLLTYSDSVADSFEAALKTSGLEQDKDLVAISGGIHHRHYRSSSSRDRAGLIEHLLASGFTPWDPRA